MTIVVHEACAVQHKEPALPVMPAFALALLAKVALLDDCDLQLGVKQQLMQACCRKTNALCNM